MFLNLFSTSSQCIIMAPEQPTTIDRILVEQILNNLQSCTKVPRSGTLSQYQLLLHLVFSLLRAAACKNRELHFSDHLGRISDISSEDTLGLTIFENHILKFQDILFLEKIARV